MHSVQEHYGIILFKTSFKPFIDLPAYRFYHKADADLGVILTINPVEDISHLFLSKTLA